MMADDFSIAFDKFDKFFPDRWE